MKAHMMAEHWTPDEVAEALDGISMATTARLWNLMEEHMGDDTKPLGGDGSDGTVEWPEPTEANHSVMAIWKYLTEEEQEEINRAFTEMYRNLGDGA